jgi:hypothetical protein
MEKTGFFFCRNQKHRVTRRFDRQFPLILVTRRDMEVRCRGFQALHPRRETRRAAPRFLSVLVSRRVMDAPSDIARHEIGTTHLLPFA